MPESKRKKKLEKTSNTDSAVYTKTYCCRCGLAYTRKKGFFSASHSPMYRGSGYLTVCNTCVDDMYDALAQKVGPKEAMRRMCMKLDLYWNEDIYEVMERTTGENSRVRNYIGKTNLVKYLNKNYDDTIAEEEDRASRVKATVLSQDEYDSDVFEPVPEEPVTPEMIDFWGSDFSLDFIRKLDKRYKAWTDDFEELDKGSIALYKQICILEETINRDAAEGKPVDKYMNTLNTMLGSANLKPTQKKTELDSSASNNTFGEWIRKLENMRPVPEPDPELKDVDGIVRYISVFFLGHLAKMLNKKSAYSEMYEREIAKLRVQRPELDYEIDDEGFFNAVYGADSLGGDGLDD